MLITYVFSTGTEVLHILGAGWLGFCFYEQRIGPLTPESRYGFGRADKFLDTTMQFNVLKPRLLTSTRPDLAEQKDVGTTGRIRTNKSKESGITI